MVKEVEFSNEVEVLASTEPYSNEVGQDLFEGHLENNGSRLHIVTHTPLKPSAIAKRKLFLFFGNIDFNSNSIEYIKIHESAFDYIQEGKSVTDNVYVFDLSRVLIIPRRVYNTAATSQLTIELYTYEANVITDYGTKRLSSPYSITSDVKYDYDVSTDGIYKLITIDFESWTPPKVYGVGDIIALNDVLLVSTIADNTNNIIAEEPTDSEPYGIGWSVATEDDIAIYSLGTTLNPPLRSFITNIMISRYAKYNKIKNALLATSFKAHDDASAYELTALLQRFRENAKYKLLSHKVIDAAYELYRLHSAATKQEDTNKVHTYNIKYTL